MKEETTTKNKNGASPSDERFEEQAVPQSESLEGLLSQVKSVVIRVVFPGSGKRRQFASEAVWRAKRKIKRKHKWLSLGEEEI